MVIRAGCLDDSSSSDDVSSGCSDDSEQIYETLSLCKTKKHLINPNDLIKATDHYEFDQNFSQTIEVELCENEGSPCTDFPKFKTSCQQRFLSIQLQVVSKNNTRSQLRTFRIPSDCECVFYRNWWRIFSLSFLLLTHTFYLVLSISF